MPNSAREAPSFVFPAICVAAIIGLLAFAFWRPILDLIKWWGHEEYSHSYIVPMIAILMAWQRLAAHRPTPVGSWSGLVWLIGGLLLLVAGELSAFRQLAHYGIPVSLFGLWWAFLGRSAAKVASPAFIYLLLAIPLPPQIYNNLSVEMQLLSSNLGVELLDLMGVPVYQDGNVIDLGGYRLQVVEACSGLRYLFPLLSFSFLAAYLLEDRWWKRTVVFLSAAPITVAMNSFRIALIGLTQDQWGIQMAEGLLHDFAGWSIFLCCTGILLVEIWTLLHVGHRGVFRLDFFTMPRGAALAGPMRIGRVGVVALTLSLLAAGGIGSGALASRPQIIPRHAGLSDFPLMIGDWHGRSGTLEADVLASLALTDYWIADYVRPDGTPPIDLYLAYYATQPMGSAIHSPSTCIPGGGWRIEAVQDRTLAISKAGERPLTVARLIIRRGSDAQLVYYWFNERGRDITSQLEAKWYLLVDSILMNRSDGSLIRLVTAVSPKEDVSQADKRLQDFLTLALPVIMGRLPGPTI